ncbi:unnamed protein product [Discosporangium mesarthrocarpum]
MPLPMSHKTQRVAAEECSRRLEGDLEDKTGVNMILECRVQQLEENASTMVPASKHSSMESALVEARVKVDQLRERTMALEAELEEAVLWRERESRRARRGAHAATKEKAARTQLQEELLNLRSYVLRSEEQVQELQEEARRQGREAERV